MSGIFNFLSFVREEEEGKENKNELWKFKIFEFGNLKKKMLLKKKCVSKKLSFFTLSPRDAAKKFFS